MPEVIVSSVKTGEFEMEYMKFGKGQKAFVILPGMSLKSVMMLGALVADIYKDFVDDYTVYLIDRRKEFGSDYSVEQMGADTVLVMKRLGIANADILGISQGGMIAQVVAENSPELVHRLVLGSTASRGNATSKAVLEKWIQLAKAGDVDALVACFINTIYTEAAAQRCMKAAINANHNATSLELRHFIVMAESCIKFDGYESLKKIRCPTLVIGARQDQIFPTEIAVEILEKMSVSGVPCEIYMYENYNHAVYDEAPDYRERIIEFFKKA